MKDASNRHPANLRMLIRLMNNAIAETDPGSMERAELRRKRDGYKARMFFSEIPKTDLEQQEKEKA